MHFINILLLLAFGALTVAAPGVEGANAAAADYNLRCNGNDIYVALIHGLASKYRAIGGDDFWCRQANSRGVHGIHAGNGKSVHDAYTSFYEIETRAGSAKGKDIADTIALIGNFCGARGGSTMVQNTDNCVVHINNWWV